MKPNALFAFLLFTASAIADDFTKSFTTLKKKGNKEAIENFLNKAAKTEKENPDFYASAGNYWWSAATKGGIQINPLPAGNFELNPDDLSITDPKTGKKVGRIGALPKAQTEEGKRAFDLLQTGMEKFPHRADLALGLAHLQKESKMDKASVDTLVALLDQARKSPGSLKWMEDGKLPGPPETFLPETVQTYSAPLFKADTPATDILCARLLDSVIKTYPDHPYAYNLKAALTDAQGKPKEALKILVVAYLKNPKDPLILSNLAKTYARQGQKVRAINAYEMLLELELEPSSREQAKAALEELKGADK